MIYDVRSRIRPIHIELQPTTDASRVARQVIDRSMEDLSSRERDDLKIAVSTLVAGPATIERDPIELDLWRVYSGVRVEERAARIEEISEAYPMSVRILNRLASHWEMSDRLAWLFFETSAPMDDADDLALFDSAAAGDRRAVEELISRYGSFAVSLSHGFRGGPVAGDDIEQVALIALNKAIDRFDPRRGVKFTSFAAPTIRGELKKWLRSSAWAVRVPRGLQELNLEAKRAFTEVSQRIGHEASLEELSASLDADSAEVEKAISAPMTQDALLRQSSDPKQDTTSLDSIASGEDTELTAIERTELNDAIRRLPEREQRILYLRFFEDLTQSEIAQRVGISQMHVSRLLASTFAELRTTLETRDPEKASVAPVN